MPRHSRNFCTHHFPKRVRLIRGMPLLDTLHQRYLAFIKHIKTKRKSDRVAGIFEQTRNKPWYKRKKNYFDLFKI